MDVSEFLDIYSIHTTLYFCKPTKHNRTTEYCTKVPKTIFILLLGGLWFSLNLYTYVNRPNIALCFCKPTINLLYSVHLYSVYRLNTASSFCKPTKHCTTSINKLNTALGLWFNLNWIWAFQGGGGAGGADRQKQQKERMEQMEDMKNSILSQVLDQEAR